MKWILTGFVFPSAVCAFLLYQASTIGKETISTLKEVGATLHELRQVMELHRLQKTP